LPDRRDGWIVDIVQLKTLIHVAELGSVSRAAQRLNIAQPALSRQIALLEAELGVLLFDRHSRGMTVTDTGRLILDRAARVLAELDAIRALAAGERGAPRGPVSIGMTPTIAQIVTVPMVRALRTAAPELVPRFSSAFSGHLVDWIRRGEVDVALSYDPPPSRSLTSRVVLIESLLLVGSAEAGLRLDRPVPFSALGGMAIVLPSAPHGLRAILETCAAEAGIALNTSVEVDSHNPMVELVRGGLGCTILPLPPIFDMVRSGQLTAAPLTGPTPERKLAIVFASDRPVSPAARFVGEKFAAIAAELAGSGVWLGRLAE